MSRPWEYDLEVTLADLPRGWAVAAIGEGKPVAAPPPVLDEIKRLRAERAQLKAAQAYLAELVAHDDAFPANPLEISQWTRKGVDLIARANKVIPS